MFRNSFPASRFCPRRTAAAVAAALALAFTGGAVAQPMGGHHGPGGAMGQGAGEEMVGHLIAKAQAQLKLDTSQQVMFDAAVAQSKAAHQQGRGLHQQARDALAAELAKSEPNLAAVAAVADTAQQQGVALRHQVRDAWLKLYATFTPDQKAVVRDLLQQRMARMDSFHQKMMEKLHGGG
jgi:Spy/CpxP family protein refolding chaperone